MTEAHNFYRARFRFIQPVFNVEPWVFQHCWLCPLQVILIPWPASAKFHPTIVRFRVHLTYLDYFSDIEISATIKLINSAVMAKKRT